MANLDNKTTALLDAIKAAASADYQARIPSAEQTSIAELGSSILSSETTRNEFITALVNKVALTIIREKSTQNPMSVFKGEQLELGDRVEDIFIELVKAQVFDQKTAESDLYKRELPEIDVLYHHINRKDFYKTTTDRSQLRRAFTSERAFNQLLTDIVKQLSMSMVFDEYIIAKSLMTQAIVEGKVFEDSSAPISDEATAKAVLKKIKSFVGIMQFMSTKFNHAGVLTSTVLNDIRIIIDVNTETEIGVEVLARAFNLSEADYIAQRITIDNFDKLNNNVHCMIVDKGWFVLHDYPQVAETLWNPQGLYWNHFLHIESVNSTSHFANAVVIKKVASVLATIDLLPATANASVGSVVQFRVEATGTNDPSSKATYVLTGNTSDDSFISTTGLLFIAVDELGTANDLTITATSTQDEAITDTATVTIV